jgi:hypothetical protein
LLCRLKALKLNSARLISPRYEAKDGIEREC